MMSGVKTDMGVIGVDENIVRGDCSTVAVNGLVTDGRDLTAEWQAKYRQLP